MSIPPLPLETLPDLPRDPQGPVVNEPWEAQAVALALRLATTGCFTWSEWSAALSREIGAAQQRGDADLATTYYHHWLNALEQLCSAKSLVAEAALKERKEAWRRAYLDTPHGEPVALGSAGGTG